MRAFKIREHFTVGTLGEVCHIGKQCWLILARMPRGWVRLLTLYSSRRSATRALRAR